LGDFFEEIHQHSFVPLPEFDGSDWTSTSFQNFLCQDSTLPVVAKGLIDDSSSVNHWDHQYLIDHFGDVEIVAMDYNQKNSDIFARMPLKEILESQLDQKNKQKFYINNSAEIFKDYPEIINEVGAQKILELFSGQCVNTFSQIFVGNQNTWGTNWHQGNDISCALMINGIKRWYFLDPRLTYILTPLMNGPNGMVSPIDARFDIEYHRINHPLYACVPKFFIDIHPGDVLFFTKYWPHAVFNRSPYQIMVNMRMTEVDLENMTKEETVPCLLPVYDNILNSDPDFINFKFSIFNSLSSGGGKINDESYFSGINTAKDELNA
jgi:hypothetical protein